MYMVKLILVICVLILKELKGAFKFGLEPEVVRLCLFWVVFRLVML